MCHLRKTRFPWIKWRASRHGGTRGGQVANGLVKQCDNWERLFKSEGWVGGQNDGLEGEGWTGSFESLLTAMSSSPAGVKWGQVTCIRMMLIQWRNRRFSVAPGAFQPESCSQWKLQCENQPSYITWKMKYILLLFLFCMQYNIYLRRKGLWRFKMIPSVFTQCVLLLLINFFIS